MRKTVEQDRDSQGFIHLQMGTNRFANQSGMTGFGMPRHNITKYKDEQRGEMPHDESVVSRQTSGWKEGKIFFLSILSLHSHFLKVVCLSNLYMMHFNQFFSRSVASRNDWLWCIQEQHGSQYASSRTTFSGDDTLSNGCQLSGFSSWKNWIWHAKTGHFG